MARSIITAIKSLGEKGERLAVANDLLRKENQALKEENDRLRQRAETAEEETRRVRLESEFLVVSHKLADNPQKLADSRRHIARLIRILDRCIAQLQVDPQL